MTTGIFDITGYHNRRSIRLRGYDYSRTGMYFITLCIHDRAQFVFGNIVGATGASPQMKLNEYGHIIRDEWERSFKIRSELILDEYVIMPDHMHAVICIGNLPGRGDRRVARNYPRDTRVARNYRDPRVARNSGRVAHINPDGTITQGDTPVHNTKGDAPVAPTTDTRETPTGPKSRSIGAMIAGFKSGTIKRINELRKTPGEWVWQRNYFEHIIRNEQSLYRIRQYIRNNPVKWFNDPKNHLKKEKDCG